MKDLDLPDVLQELEKKYFTHHSANVLSPPKEPSEHNLSPSSKESIADAPTKSTSDIGISDQRLLLLTPSLFNNRSAKQLQNKKNKNY